MTDFRISPVAVFSAENGVIDRMNVEENVQSKLDLTLHDPLSLYH